MRKFLAILALLTLPTLAWAQQATTTVRATATMGVNFSGGAIKATQIVPNGTGTPSYSFFFDAGGNMVFVAPGGTYQFEFCNVLSACFIASGTLTQNNIDLTTVFNTAASITAGVSSVNGRAGAVTILPGDIPNNSANTTGNAGTASNLSGTPALPNGTTATTQTAGDSTTKLATDAFVIGNGGTGSAFNPAGPITGIYFANTCPPANNGQCFFANANTQQNNSCSWTAATPSTVTCGTQQGNVSGAVTSNVATYTALSMPAGWAIGNSISVLGFTGADTYLNTSCTLTGVTATTVSCALTHANGTSTTQGIITNTSVGPFGAGDVNKQVAGWKTCAAFASDANMGANAITASGAPIITTFLSGTQVQITTAANAQATQTGCFIWGTPDDAAAAALEAFYDQSPFCPRIILAASYYMLTKPVFASTPVSCAAEAYSQGNVNPGFGNVFYAGGVELEGRGVGPTQVFLMPNFPNGDSCTRGQNSLACFVVPTEGRWHDFALNGGGNALWAAGQGHELIYADVGSIDNFACINMGAFDTSSTVTGFFFGWQTQLNQVINSGCGSIGAQIVSGQGANTWIKTSIENSRAIGLAIQGAPGDAGEGSLTCYDCHFLNSQAATTPGGGAIGILNKGGTVRLYHTKLGGGGISQSNAFTAYSCTTNATCILQMSDSSVEVTPGAAGNNGLSCSVACATYLQNTTLTAGASGKTYADVAGSKLFDQGGNTFGSVSISGQVFGSLSITGTLQTSGNFAIAPASSATFSAVTGNSLNGQVTATWAGTPSTTETITMAFPTTFLVAPRCTVVDVGGTNPFPTAIDTTNTATTTTTLTIKETFAVAPTVGNTDLFVWSCSN